MKYLSWHLFFVLQEEIYNLAQMSKSSLLDKTIQFTSSIFEETVKSGTTYEFGIEATKVNFILSLVDKREVFKVSLCRNLILSPPLTKLQPNQTKRT